MHRKSRLSVPRFARLAAVALAAAVLAPGAFAYEPDGLKLGVRVFGVGRAALSVEWVRNERGLRAEFGIFDTMAEPQAFVSYRFYTSDASLDELSVTPFISLGAWIVGDLAKGSAGSSPWGGLAFGGGASWYFADRWSADLALEIMMALFPEYLANSGLSWGLAGRL